MHTIGQVSDMTGLPVSTLRFYDKEGLFPNMARVGGQRRFGEDELEALRVIECLKTSGLEIRDIRRFMDWTKQGPSTYPQRKQLFEERRKALEEEMARLQRSLDMLRFKCWYYETAIVDGGEERLANMIPDKLPPDIQRLYDNAHDLTRQSCL